MVTTVSERFGNGNGGVFNGFRARIEPPRGVATPAVSGGAVVIGGGFGSYEVYALDWATGTLRWHLRTSDDGPTAAIVVDGVVLFNTESCTLAAVDVATGALLWEKWLGDPLMAQPAAADGRVVMAYPKKGTHRLVGIRHPSRAAAVGHRGKSRCDYRTGDQRWPRVRQHL
jgi:outer membrane protein assembly factor BamB